MKLGLIHLALLIGAICAVAHASPAPAKAQIIGGHRVGESALMTTSYLLHSPYLTWFN